MREFYCKIITTEFTPATQQQIVDFIQKSLSSIGVDSILWQLIAPYWKDPKARELSFTFSSEKTLSEIQLLFADRWQQDTADVRWSNILCPSTAFIWLSQ